jgi:hypothetical protein
VLTRPALLVSLALTACTTARAAGGAASPSAPAAVDLGAPATFAGVVRYEARRPTPQGASQAVELRPARYVEVVAEGADHRELARTVTDAEGRFSLQAPARAPSLAVFAHAARDGNDVRVSAQADGSVTHALRLARPDASRPIELTASDQAADGIAGAFHIADTVLTGLDVTREWTAQMLPPLVVYWGRGVTTEWSYYRGERPAHSGRFCLELLGGSPGRQRSTDTDEHDEGIILHELGHFVFDRLSSNSSTGGSHPAGYLIDPGLAWEEGRATWFSSAVRRDPHYQDTIGLEPEGSLRVDHDLEHSAPGARGIGNEMSVSDVLWDLIDGSEGYPDDDHDGVAVPPAVIMRAMMTWRDQPSAYPALGTFLRLITAGDAPAVRRDDLLAMLGRTREPAALLPRDDAEDWPSNLAVPGAVGGKVDGLTNPAPSGGRARPENGYDALRVYRVRIAARAWLHLELVIEGSGRPADHTDLDLELRDHRGDLITAARGSEGRETLGRLLEPGFYYVYVRDGGQGNRANFELRARTNVIGAP